MQALASSDQTIRLGALRRIGAAAPREAAVGRAVVPLLSEADSRLRGAAAYALGQIREPVEIVVPALVAALEDKDSEVRQAAAAVLGKFPARAESAVPALITAFGDTNHFVRYAALASIRSMIRDADVLPMDALRRGLERILDSNDEDEPAAAKRALEELDLRFSKSGRP